jgi:hypothetical protein
VSPVETTLRFDATAILAGAAAILRFEIKPTEAVVTTATATLFGPSGVVLQATLRDDGLAPDTVAGDRVFAGSATPAVAAASVGRWSAEARAIGEVRGLPFDQAAGAMIDVLAAQPSAQPVSAALSKPRFDGRFTEIAVTADVNVVQAGSFRVAGTLLTPDGAVAGRASTLLPAALVGRQVATLVYPVESLATRGTSGKFRMTDMTLTDVTSAPVVVARQAAVFETAFIDVTTLATPGEPTLQFTSPTASSALASEAFTITWSAADPDDDATISLYLDMDAQGGDGAPVAGARAISEDTGPRSFTLSVAGLPEGQYFVHALIADDETVRSVYASAPLRVGLDTDGDGLLDVYEAAHGLNPASHDSEADLDVDGLTNGLEAGLGSLPEDADTDGGGEPDGRELRHGRDPLIAGDDVRLPGAAHVVGDVFPAGAPNGKVTVGDLVLAFRLHAGTPAPTSLQRLVLDFVPAALISSAPTPPRYRQVGDGVLAPADLKAIVDEALGKRVTNE